MVLTTRAKRFGSSLFPFCALTELVEFFDPGLDEVIAPLLDTLLYSNRFSCFFEVIHDNGLLHSGYIGCELLKDLSGSMDQPLSRNSTLRLKEVGALFGAILAEQGAQVGGFGDDFQTVSTHVETPVFQRQQTVLRIDEEVGNSTNGWKALEYLRERGEVVERIVVFTDMQIWDSTLFTARDARTVKAEFDAYRDAVASETALYLVDLAAYGNLVTPEGYENVYNVSGWSENVLSFIDQAETPMQVIGDIQAVEPP